MDFISGFACDRSVPRADDDGGYDDRFREGD